MSDQSPPATTRLSLRPDRLGESPVWDHGCGTLYWVDGVAGAVNRITPAGQRGRHDLGGHVGAIALADRGLVVALEHEILLWNPATDWRHSLLRLEDADPAMRLNDGKTDRQGRFLCAGMGRDGGPRGALHQLDPHRGHRVLFDGLRIGNGLCFSPEGGTLYYADTPARMVFARDYDPVTGDVGPERRHLDTGRLGSGVDGATVDSEGRLWAALIRTGEIASFLPDGRIWRRFPAPTDLPSSLAFGGDDLRTLFVTSIRDSGTGRAVSRHPDGGHLFALDGLGATGLPEARFSLGTT